MRKINFTTFLVFAVIMTMPAISSTNVQGVVASNYLEVTEDSYVNGVYLMTNNTITDHLAANIEIKVVDRFFTTDTSTELVAIEVSFELFEDILDFGDTPYFQFTTLINVNTRRSILPVVQCQIDNGSYTFGASLLHETTVTGIQNYTNTIVNLNGSTYAFSDLTIPVQRLSMFSLIVAIWYVALEPALIESDVCKSIDLSAIFHS